jgi:hypothetical protein
MFKFQMVFDFVASLIEARIKTLRQASCLHLEVFHLG